MECRDSPAEELEEIILGLRAEARHFGISRNYARSQPTGKKRKRRTWLQCLEKLRAWGKLPRLAEIQQGPFRAIVVRRRSGGEPCEGEPHARF